MVGIFLIGWKMAEEIEFANRHFWNFKTHVTLTLTLDDLESHIIVNVSSTLTNTTVWFVAALCFIVDERTYGRTDFFTGFIRSSLRRWPKRGVPKMENHRWRLENIELMLKIVTFTYTSDIIVIEYLSKWAGLRGHARSKLRPAIIYYFTVTSVT